MNLTWYRSIMGDPQRGRTKSGHIAVLVACFSVGEASCFLPDCELLEGRVWSAFPVLFVCVPSTWLVLGKLLNG